MRASVYGHRVVYYSLTVQADFENAIFIACTICGTRWMEVVASWYVPKLRDGRDRRSILDFVRKAASRTPTCERAYRDLVTREVMES